MTRARLMSQIRGCLNEEQLLVDDTAREAAVVASDCTLNYLLDYALTVSEQMMSQGLHSESMVAGMFIEKIKALKSNS